LQDCRKQGKELRTFSLLTFCNPAILQSCNFDELAIIAFDPYSEYVSSHVVTPARRSVVVLASLLFSTLPVLSSPTARVTLHDGLATVVATNATVAEVLEEWSRAGGTAIVNAEQLNTQRVTIELIDVPEKQALDTVLRSAAAYLAVERPVASPSGSKYGRIVILASSVAPKETRPAFAAPPPTYPTFTPPPPGAAQRMIGPDGQPVPDDQEGAPPPNRPAAPPGFSSGDAPPDRQPATAPTTTPRAPVGVPVPGMIVAPPRPQPPQPQR